MKSYPLFRRENIPAYVSVMAAWAVFSVASAGALVEVSNSISFTISLIWASITVMLGMLIMFVASFLNLRKLTPGFKRLADGQRDPQIPPVWCPVLTAATNAAIELNEKLQNQQRR